MFLHKSQVDDFGVAIEALGQVVLAAQNIFKELKMMLMSSSVDDGVINVDDDVLDVFHHFFHLALE